MSDLEQRTEALLSALFEADGPRVVSLLGTEARLDIPRAAAVAVGGTEVQRLAESWPALYEGLVLDGIETIGPIVGIHACAVELRLSLSAAQRTMKLPVVVVWDLTEAGAVTAVRIYHSERLLSGQRALRRPTFPVASNPEALTPEALPAPIDEYTRGLMGQDVETTMAAFAPDACIVAAGRTVSERDELRRLVEAMVERGGVNLIRNAEIDDGRCYLLEFTSLRATPSSGAAVYERSGDKLGAVRVYDDMDPDALLAGRPPQRA